MHTGAGSCAPLFPASPPFCAIHLSGFGHGTGAQLRCSVRGYTPRGHNPPVLWEGNPCDIAPDCRGRDSCVEPLCHLESGHSALAQPLICQKKNTNRLIFFRIIKQRNSNKAKNIEMVTARVWLKSPKITSVRARFQSSRHRAAHTESWGLLFFSSTDFFQTITLDSFL